MVPLVEVAAPDEDVVVALSAPPAPLPASARDPPPGEDGLVGGGAGVGLGLLPVGVDGTSGFEGGATSTFGS
ncbi:MAG TPA: hypothetical protein VFY36_01250, partial [Solirubrobacteraceae bacterium]|nr:hypothetical protein [Solirubrobacteraceae bacterium]